ncbi:MAG: transposase, partial [Candidatus Competibacteraceae bacterium]
MPMTLAVPLDLPDVRVLAHRMLEDGTVLIEVESTLQTTRCHRCGREIDRFHGFDRSIQLQHLPVFGRRVVVEIRPKRYRCPHGESGPTTTQRCTWYDPNCPHTTAFEQEVLKRLIHSTVADISRSLGLGVKAVEG